MGIDQGLVADNSVVLGGVVRAAQRLDDPKSRQPVRKRGDSRAQPVGAAAAISACGIHGCRDAEIQVLAETMEAAVDLRQAGAALEGEPRIARGQILQHDTAEVILLDEARGESGFRRREPDRLAQQRGVVLVPPDRHAQASPFTTTPQRRLMLPRLGCVGIHGIRLDERGSFFSSFFSRRASTPSRSSNAPIRRTVPTSP